MIRKAPTQLNPLHQSVVFLSKTQDTPLKHLEQSQLKNEEDKIDMLVSRFENLNIFLMEQLPALILQGQRSPRYPSEPVADRPNPKICFNCNAVGHILSNCQKPCSLC